MHPKATAEKAEPAKPTMPPILLQKTLSQQNLMKDDLLRKPSPSPGKPSTKKAEQAKPNDKDTEPLKEDVPGKPSPSKQEAEMPNEHASVPPQLGSSKGEVMEGVLLENLPSSKFNDDAVTDVNLLIHQPSHRVVMKRSS